MSLCNYCTVLNVKKRRESGQKVSTVPAKGDLEGFNVYLHYAGDKIDHKLHYAGWVMEVQDKCKCIIPQQEDEDADS